MAVFRETKYLVIGAGIHGLSVAWHLACALKVQNKGSGADILVVDKGSIGAGSSGIACGVIRNNYSESAMRELIAHSVDVWEEDGEGYGYHPVGYIQASPDVMREDVARIAEEQRSIGYRSSFVDGKGKSTRHMKDLIGTDWQAQGITSILHEKRGGYANNLRSLHRLATKAEHEGVRILSGIEVTGFQFGNQSNSIVGIETQRGLIKVDYVIIGAGPWINNIWNLLGLPKHITLQEPKTLKRMWHYLCLQEGTLGVEPELGRMRDGSMPPVIHVDTDAPLYSDVDGELITDKLWGVYYKPDPYFNGIQGGALPYEITQDADCVAVDPYGPSSTEFLAGDEFVHMFCSALAFCQGRFSGKIGRWKREASGGIGAFSPDNFPVFDEFFGNCYIIADSSHGYKMIGVGKLVAEEVCGSPSTLLEKFRYERFKKGNQYGKSNSPFVWS